MMSQRLALSIELIDVSSLELSRRNFFFEEVVDLVESSVLGLGQSEDYWRTVPSAKSLAVLYINFRRTAPEEAQKCETRPEET